MKEIRLPYDTGTQTLHIPEKNLAGVLVSHQASYQAKKTGAELVEDSLDHPIGSPRLEELAKGKKNIVIISSDHTRPVPSAIIMPILLRRIRSVAPDARIRILVATGFHRASTRKSWWPSTARRSWTTRRSSCMTPGTTPPWWTWACCPAAATA